MHPGISNEAVWEKICVIDTENGSGSLYVGTVVGGTRIGEYLAIALEAPFSAARYLEAIEAAEDAGVEFLIIDSLSHAWSGEGGLLDMQANIAKRSGNGYTAWRDVTPLHNKLVDKILQCPMHVAATLRTKTEYVIEDNGQGKKAPRKVGMAPIFREGLEYEFSVFFELAQDHSAAATKDRTGLFDGQYFVITPDTGAKIAGWLGDAEKNAPAPAAEKPQTKQQTPEPSEPAPEPSSSEETDTRTLAEKVDAVMKACCADITQEEREKIAQRIRAITGGTANYRAITDKRILQAIYDEFKEETV